MKDRLQFSAKTIGFATLPGACPRCVYIKTKTQGRMPYGIFPGIFSRIDSYTKKQVLAHWDAYEKLPKWLSGFGEPERCINPPSSWWFRERHRPSGLLVTGEADGMFEMKDQSWIIADYKVARYRGDQDPLLHVYRVQLNGYRFLAEALGHRPVKKLLLVYTEPIRDPEAILAEQGNNPYLVMGFKRHVHEIEIDPEVFDFAALRVREIAESSAVPDPIENCKDCRDLAGVAEVLADGGDVWTELGLAK